MARWLSPRRLFYGWWIVAAGFIIQMFCSGLGTHTSGAFVVVLQDDFGWSKALISGAFAASTVEAALLAPLQGRLVDMFGPRAVVRAGVVFLGLGLMATSTINSLSSLYLVMLLIGLGYTLAFDVAPQTAVVNWFRRRRGAAMGFMMAGFGAGGALVPGVALAMTALGWRRAVLIGGAVMIAVGLAAAQLLRRSPEEYGELPDGMPLADAQANDASTAADGGMAELTAQQAFRIPSFWFLAVGQALFMFGVTAVGVHLIPHTVERLGLSLGVASTLITTLTVCIVVGQVSGGFVGDRVNKHVAIVVYTVVQAAALALLAFGGSLAPVLLFVVLQGLIVGSRGPLMMSIRADYFGRRAYGTVWGLSLFVVNVGNMAGMVLTGYLADRFGSYQAAFILLLALTVVAALLLAMARRPSLRLKTRPG